MRRNFTNKCLLSVLLAIGLLLSADAQTLPMSIGYSYVQAPRDVAVASNGDLYILTTASVQVFRNGAFVRAFEVYQNELPSNDPALTGIAVGANGNVYVVDASNDHVRVFNSSGVFLRTFGRWNYENYPVLGAFRSASGIAVAPNGEIYVSDLDRSTIQVFSSTFEPVRMITPSGAGYLGRPIGISFDLDSHLYVVDYENKKVIVLDASGNFVRVFQTGDDGYWLFPRDIAIDAAKNIYVGHSGSDAEGVIINEVRVYNNNGTFLKNIGATGRADHQLEGLAGIAMHNGSLYTCAMPLGKLVVYDLAGNYVSKIGGESDRPGKLANFARYGGNSSVRIDSKGNYLAIDHFKNYIHVFNTAGAFVKTIGVPGTADGQLQNVEAFALDANDNLYVIDKNGDRIQVFNAAGQYQRAFRPTKYGRSIEIGKDNRIYSLASGNNTLQRYSSAGVLELEIPLGYNSRNFALDRNDNIYINQQSPAFGINVFSKDGVFIRRFGNRGEDEGEFYEGALIALDNDDNVYLFDYSSHVSVFRNDGTYVKRQSGYGELTPGKFLAPFGIDVSGTLGNGRIAVLDESRLQVFGTPQNSLSFDELPAKQYGDAPFNLSAVSEAPVTFTSSNAAVATVSGNTVTVKAPGTTQITARQAAGADGWSGGVITRTLTVNKASQVITLEPLGPFTLADQMVKPNVTSTSALPMSYSSSDPAIASFSGQWLVFHKAGKVTITITQPGNTNYADAQPVAQELQINKVTQTITFEALPEKFADALPFVLTATSTSDQAISFESSDPAIASIEDNTVTVHKTGTLEITARQAETDYYAASSAIRTLTIIKRPQTVAFGLPALKSVSDEPFEITGNSTSGLPVTYESSDLTIASVSGNTVTLHGEGVVSITAKQNGNDIWAAANPVSRELTVTAKQLQNISFTALPVKTYGDLPFTLSATSSSGLPVTYTSNESAIATVQGDVLTIHKAGQVTITAHQGGNDSFFAATNVSHVLIINKAAQTVTFPALSDKTFSSPVFPLSATASSGLPVQYASSNPLVATVNDGVATIAGLGSTTIRATQAGNENYFPATAIEQTFTVMKDAQVITFDALPEKTMGEEPFTISASTTSDLPLTFTSSNTAVATVNGNVVTLVGAGTTVIRATQSGNERFLPATKEQTLIVKLVTDAENPIGRVSVYPNPATNVLVIPIDRIDGAIQVVDTKGVVTQLTAVQDHDAYEVDVTALKDGIYTVIVPTNGKILTTRIVKK